MLSSVLFFSLIFTTVPHNFGKCSNNRTTTDDELFIIEEEVIETEFGWVFPYDSKKFLETNDLIHALVGNAPIIFDNRDESIHVTGTSHDAYFYINQHVNNYRPKPKSN